MTHRRKHLNSPGDANPWLSSQSSCGTSEPLLHDQAASASHTLVTVCPMASEWVGVIGTAVGAGIAGMVGVASLVVRGRQDAEARRELAEREDRLRAEDRAWTVKERDVEQRRAIYADLLDRARAITNDLGAMNKHGHASAGPGSPESDDLFKMGRDLVQRNLDEFRALISRASLSAIDQEPLRRADAFFAEATGLHVLLSQHRQAPLDQLLGLIDLKANLEEACRRDLDLSVAEGSPRPSQLLKLDSVNRDGKAAT